LNSDNFVTRKLQKYILYIPYYMEKEEFDTLLLRHSELIAVIRKSAHELHQSVNQIYGRDLPYGYHLDQVANAVREYGYLVCANEADVIPLMFGAYYHDSIEDARLTYNDVKKTALHFMDAGQALMATEIVYALTNDKGRTRAERAGEKYYQGIRETPYAPFVKLCDRMANITFSCSGGDSDSHRMKEVYKQEVPHFLASINPHSDDPRLAVPAEVVERLAEQLIDEMEREENKDLHHSTGSPSPNPSSPMLGLSVERAQGSKSSGMSKCSS
jgi:hypothetical protein